MLRLSTSFAALPLVAALGALALSGAARAEDVRTTEGLFAGAHVVSIQNRGTVAAPDLRLAFEGRDFPRREVDCRTVQAIAWAAADDPPPASPGSPAFVLRNGDVIRGQVGTSEREGCVLVRTSTVGSIDVDLLVLHAIVFADDEDALARRVDERLREAAAQDVVFLKSGGRAEGTVSTIDEHGVLIDVAGLGETTLELERVETVLLSPLGPPPERPQGIHATVRLHDGTRLTGPIIAFDRDRLDMETLVDSRLPIPESHLHDLVFRGGAFVYLSELEPGSARQSFGPFEGASDEQLFPWIEAFAWKRDRSCSGGPIRLGGRAYAFGLGVHSRTELRYDLGGRYRTFRSWLGLDDEARELARRTGVEGSVTFQILVDARPQLEQGLLATTSDEPRFVEVDVTGAREITLLVDLGRTFHELGRADWADAHLIRE